ncbi:hypothetical protein AB832_08005 [Flavobacteriaceae bacterium (ex Bugula neritina AB1)]|nr:hypothetical protein AB832_08005 [Flavobacteriaceae bacterium (ex Bugula neritina AB1)]
MFKYKSKNKSNPVHRDWKKCTAETKERIEKQHPGQFVFEEIKPPAKTESMKKAEKESKEK